MTHKNNRFLLESFENNFSVYRDNNVPMALYGIGLKTQLILENLSGYNIVGLMDRDTVGSYVYGRLVLSYDQVISSVKLVVIVANLAVTDLIFQRISFLKDHGIKILRINGSEPTDLNKACLANSYFDSNYNSLINLIDAHDVISFDLFDTLILRRVLLPTDIFDLVEIALVKRFGSNLNFKARRIEAQYYCYNEIGEFFNILDVYNELRRRSDIPSELVDQVFEIELLSEYENCLPRKTIVSAMEYAFDSGKYVCITTDTYLNKEYIFKLIKCIGLKSYNELHVSCELKKSKACGSMWEYFNEIYSDSKVLHIGDNFISDIENAKSAGIDAYEVKNAMDLIAISSLEPLRKYTDIFEDRLMLGQVVGHILNDPFIFKETKGLLEVNTMYDLGYLSFGPLILKFLLWLIRTSKKHKIDTLLFFARDGYLLERLYKKIVNFLRIDAPTTIYFYTSRRASSVAAIFSNDDISFVVNEMCNIKKTTIEQMLLSAFGIYPDKADSFIKQSFFEISKKQIIDHITKNYSQQILKNAESERNNYLQYISSLGGLRSNNTGCVNYVGRGVTQRSISKVIGKELYGYYFATESDMRDIMPSLDKIFALYGDFTHPHIDTSLFISKYLFGEVVLSSPDEQVIKFDEKGAPLFQNRKQERVFRSIDECHQGIVAYVDDMLKTDPNLIDRTFNANMVMLLYDIFSSNNCLLSDRVKNSFSFCDYYDPTQNEVCLLQ